MAKPKILLLLAVFFFANLSAAQSPEELFLQGTQAYLSKDYQKAQEAFQQSLDLDPQNPTILTNLALTQYQLGQQPLAIGLLRKALTLDPDLGTARESLKFILTERPLKEIPRTLNSYETLRAQFLQPIPLTVYLALSLLTFAFSGWTLVSYIGRRKTALQEESALPPFPVIPSILALAFCVFSALFLLKLYDSTLLRGTIVTESTPLQTAPGDNQVAIMEVPGGLEVQLRVDQGDWVQIHVPGSATGWIKKTAVLMTR